MTQPPNPPSGPYGASPGYGGYGPPGYQPVDPTLAEWWQRLLARFIDGAITGLGSYVVSLVLIFSVAGIVSASGEPSDTAGAVIGIVTGVVYILLLVGTPFVYEWLMLKKKGRTLGKIALKIQPVNAETRQPLTDAEALKRALYYPLLTGVVGSITCGILSLLDGLWPLWDKPLAQAVHDKAARTVVIKTELPAGGYRAPYGYAPPAPPPPGYYPQ